jgi:hypothetical protein
VYCSEVICGVAVWTVIRYLAVYLCIVVRYFVVQLYGL